MSPLVLTITPLRNMVLVKLVPPPVMSALQVIQAPRAVQQARIMACGPEVTDLKVGMVALVNTAAATQLNGQLLVPQTAILGTL